MTCGLGGAWGAGWSWDLLQAGTPNASSKVKQAGNGDDQEKVDRSLSLFFIAVLSNQDYRFTEASHASHSCFARRACLLLDEASIAKYANCMPRPTLFR
jgi:hypothetical protein